jgi:8-hydroxy-5-deazaflavin:NADPH oxidoreductase
MNIGIIGAGNVGSALGKRWAAGKHEIKFGVRDVAKPEVRKLLETCGWQASAGSVSDAAHFGEVIVLTTPFPATEAVIESAGDLNGKILVDCTNPLKPDLSGLTIGHDTSAAEQVASWAKGARVVKCFNTTGSNNMENASYADGKPVIFCCGGDTRAKQIVTKLGEELGFEMIDAGALEIARLLEPVAMLWIHLAYRGGLGRDFAFKLMRR